MGSARPGFESRLCLCTSLICAILSSPIYWGSQIMRLKGEEIGDETPPLPPASSWRWVPLYAQIVKRHGRNVANTEQPLSL